MKTAMLTLLLLAAIVSGVSGDSITIQEHRSSWGYSGQLIQTFSLEHGVAYLLIRNESLALCTQDEDGGYDQAGTPLYLDGAPRVIMISACDNIIHAFINWPDGEIQYFKFVLNDSLRECRHYQIYFPVVGGQP